VRTLIVLGSTGSVGTQALEVVRRNADRFKVVGLSAGANHGLLIAQVREFAPPVVALADEDSARDLKDKLGPMRGVEILAGPDAAERIAREADADTVLNAMVGSAGLGPTLASLQSGKTLALANKESLVAGGELVLDLVKGEPERLVPVDSEHMAIAQCLRGEAREDVKRVVLTGSGGPFRGWTRTELSKASVKDALAHPVWQMGPKITIDSATLMNKGLEVIEAHYLFGIPYEAIHVVIHPEGIVHGMVEFSDGGVVSQMAVPDMRLPIQLALGWPERLPAGVAAPPLVDPDSKLTFEPVDREVFPAVDLAYRVGEMGMTYPAVMSAANEVAVTGFLEGRIRLTRIVEVAASVVDEHEPASVVSVVNLERADAWARRRAAEMIESG